jgi:hypothetical protein
MRLANDKDKSMPATATLETLISLTDGLVCITLLTIWLVLIRNRREGSGPIAIGVVIAAALGWAALWAWYPPLAALRLNAPPGGQVAAILTLVIGLPSLLIFKPVRHLFASVPPISFVALGPWRIVYGSSLWLIGALGGLPQAFYVSAGLGDIIVGLWAVAILLRRSAPGIKELTAWNGLGLLDLLHVLALAAVNLRPFYLDNPDLPPANLLPLVGVPMFIALHVMTLWAIARSPKTAQ